MCNACSLCPSYGDECQQLPTLLGFYGIHPVPGYLPHDSSLWDPLIDLLVSQSKDIHSCVIDILNTQARRSHDQFVGELRSLEHQVGRDLELASGTRMKLAQYCNTAQRRKLIEHHKHIQPLMMS